MLIENNEMYAALERVCTEKYGYSFVNAIYDIDENTGLYHAAVDLHEPGETYHVYFMANDDGSIIMDVVNRWLMG